MNIKYFFYFFSLMMYTATSIQGAAKSENNSKNIYEKSNEYGSQYEIFPNAVINNSVNLITGEFCDSSIDLYNPGIANLYLERALENKKHQMTYLKGWTINLLRKANFNDESRVLTLSNGNEPKIEFRPLAAHELPNTIRIGVNKDRLNYFFTNAASSLSGNTNKKNELAYINKRGNNLRTIGANYDRTYFNGIHLANRTLHANRLQTLYHYEGNILKRAEVINPLNEVISHIDLIRLSDEKFMKDPVVKIKGEGSSTIQYSYHKKKKGDRMAFLLNEVNGNRIPQTVYEHTLINDNLKEPRISKRIVGGKNFISNIYYDQGTHKLLDKSIKLKDVDDWRYGRVKAQFEPVGRNAQAVCTYLFEYEDIGDDMGITNVWDAYKTKISYTHDFGRLSRIKRYGIDDPNTVYSEDKFWWIDEGDEVGNLRAKALSSGNNYLIHHCNVYIYDKRHNVIKEHFLGTLTGRNNESPMLGREGHIVEYNKSDEYIKYYDYYDDDRNVIKSEDDGRKKILYDYYEDSNLLKTKFLYVDGKIQTRTFYHYDKNSALQGEIYDDGCSTDQNDLTGVTERYIKESFNRTEFPIGLPERVYYKCLDRNIGHEKLLYKKFYYYSPEGWLIQEDIYDSEDHFVSTQKWKHDARGNIIEEINALGHIIYRKYDEVGNCIFEKGPRQDFYKEYQYDFVNRLIAEEEIHEDGVRLKKSYTYDYLGNKVEEVDIYGNVTNYKYDVLSRLKEVITPSGSKKEFSYNVSNQKISEKAIYGNETKFKYTSRGQPLYISTPDGKEEFFYYHLDGALHEHIDANKIKTIFKTDYLGRITSKYVYSNNGEFLFETSAKYNAFHLLEEIDAAGNSTHYEYDFAGREVRVSQGNRVKETLYDSLGRVSKQIILNENDSIINKFEYDLLGRVIYEAILNGKEEIQTEKWLTYDCDGNVIEERHVGKSGVSIRKQEVNAHGIPTRTIDAEGKITLTNVKYNYFNQFGQRVGYKEIIDPMGKTTIIIKNIENQDAEIIEKDPLGKILHVTEFIYNALGQLSERKDHVHQGENKQYTLVKRWFYNTSNDLVCSIDAVGTPLQKEFHIIYNKYGQKEHFIKPDGSAIFYKYNSRGLLESTFSSDGTIDYHYEYDILDNILTIQDRKDGTTTERSYDKYSQVIKEKLSNGLEMKYSYDYAGRTKEIIFPDNSYAKYIYDGAFLRKIERYQQDGSFQYVHSYDEYDKKGLCQSVTLAGNAGKIGYEYDLLNRTRKIESKNFKDIISNFDYSGNLTQKVTIDPLGTQEQVYQYSSQNQLISENDYAYEYDSINNRLSKNQKENKVNFLNQVTNDGFNSYEYDLNGNLKKISGQKEVVFEYDAWDRLVRCHVNNEVFRYIYDGKNRRVSKIKGNDHENYFYFDQSEIGFADESGIIRQLRVIGNGKGAEIGSAIALEIEGEKYVPIHDYQGNVAILVSLSTGEVEETYRYTSFGEEKVANDFVNPWRFSSKRIDLETGFINFGYRYYSPNLGKWISTDPLGDKDGPNLYAYVKNNPLTNFDIYGLCCQIHGKCETVRRQEEEKYARENGLLYVRDKRERHKTYIAIVGVEREKDLNVMYASGVGTTPEYCSETGRKISENYMDHAKLTIICNSTKGVIRDLFDRMLLMFGIEYEHIRITRREIIEKYNAEIKKGVVPDLGYLAHSKGGPEFYHAARVLPREIRQCISVRTFGSAKIIPKDFCGDVLNIINPNDIVPRTDPLGLIQHSDAIKYTDYRGNSWDSFIRDHFIDSKGYQDEIKTFIHERKKKI